MARPVRIEFPGALYHITSRGNRKEKIFEDDKDRNIFLEIIASVAERHNWLLFAYCLMYNHYHLLIETPDGNLSMGMRQLNGVYTQRFNKRHKRPGHLFQGRFKAILVEKEGYLLELCRYVVLNPVRAEIVNYPWQWQWSSYLATAGVIKVPKFFIADWILSQFAKDRKEAREHYKEFVMAGIKEETPWRNLKGGIILGKEIFVEKIKGLLATKKEIREIPRIERFATRPKLTEIFRKIQDKDERHKNIHIAHIKYGYTLKEIGDYLGIHYSTVSKSLKRMYKEKGNRVGVKIHDSRPDPSGKSLPQV